MGLKSGKKLALKKGKKDGVLRGRYKKAETGGSRTTSTRVPHNSRGVLGFRSRGARLPCGEEALKRSRRGKRGGHNS